MGENNTSDDLFKYIQAINEKCDQIRIDIANVKKDLSEEIEKINLENRKLKEENNNLKVKLNVVEQKLRKYNLIVYGLEEQKTEIGDIQEIIKIFNQKLDIKCRFDDIRDIYRLGKYYEGKNRPLSIELVNYKLKIELLHKAKLLKGTSIYLANDYTPGEYQKQKVLRKHMIDARSENCKAYIKKNILYIEDKGYTFEDLSKLSTEQNKDKDNITDSEENPQNELNAQTAKPLPNKINKNKQQQLTSTSSSSRKRSQSIEDNPLKRSTRQKGRV